MDHVQPAELSNNALMVLNSRYLLHKQNETETPAELFARVARGVAVAELKWGTKDMARKWEASFYEMMSSLLFLPNSPTLMNAGTSLNQLSACFVLPVNDSLAEIFTTLKNAALIQQSGGGTGFNFSHLRPKDDPLTITQGTASGPVSFMKVFNAATEYIKHGGKRRGANMGILNIEHPDIEAFIHAKSVGNELDNFNISVGISDAFMKAVEGSSDWQLIHPKTKAVTSTVKARNLWNSIIENAWKTGDPGLVFLDTINENNPLPVSGRLEATNPCGELPLFPYEACNLGSINLARLVNNHGNIEWERLGRLVNTAIRFLDDVIDAGNYILPETLAIVHKNRKIGLGVMGWADLLVRQQIPYESEAALALAERIMKFLWQKSTEASEDLARERGSFPNWKNSIYYPSQPMRNATRLSIAPTGTISIIADTSPSIEPLFALAFQRKQVLNGQTLPEVNKYFLDYIKEFDLYTQELVDRVMSSGSIADVAGLPPEMKNIFRTALEVTPEWHLKHQVAFQKYIDNGVSKTINLPFQCTVDDVAYIYKMAWLQKAKGITIFRDQSKNRQVLEKGIIKKETACKTC